MSNLPDYTHIKQQLAACTVRYKNISESLLIVFFKVVLSRNYILPIRYYELEHEAHKDGEHSHTLRVYLLIEYGQDHDGNYSIAYEHNRDNNDSFQAQHRVPHAVFVVKDDSIVNTHRACLEGLANEVYGAHQPEVDTDITLSGKCILLHHNVVGIEQETMEDHEAHIHEKDRQVLKHF